VARAPAISLPTVSRSVQPTPGWVAALEGLAEAEVELAALLADTIAPFGR